MHQVMLKLKHSIILHMRSVRFSHFSWQCRWYLSWSMRIPISKEWYDIWDQSIMPQSLDSQPESPSFSAEWVLPFRSCYPNSLVVLFWPVPRVLGTPLVGAKFWRITTAIGFMNGFLVAYQNSCSTYLIPIDTDDKNDSGDGLRMNEKRKRIWQKWLVDYVLENLYMDVLQWMNIINESQPVNPAMHNLNSVFPLIPSCVKGHELMGDSYFPIFQFCESYASWSWSSEIL